MSAYGTSTSENINTASRDKRVAELENTLHAVQQQLAAERAKVAELEKSESEAWSKYSELLKDRNALLDQTRIGPLRAEEWQVRAIQAERNLKAEQVKVALAVQTLRKLFYAAEPVADAFTESLFAEVCAVLNQSSDVLVEIRREVARECAEILDAMVFAAPESKWESSCNDAFKRAAKAIRNKFGVAE